MQLRTNRLKESLQGGRVVLGSTVDESRQGGPIHAMALGGIDFVVIDLEHTALSVETAADLIAHAHAAGVTPVVRVPDLSYRSVTQILDAGCQSLLVPGLKTPAEVEELLRLSRYAPEGQRGIGLYGHASSAYQVVSDLGEATRWLNDQLLLGLIIETKEAMERLDDMLAPGIDFALVGWGDLAQAYGIMGDLSFTGGPGPRRAPTEHPLIVEAMLRVQKACAERGIAYAAAVGSLEALRAAVDGGADMVCYGGVLAYIRAGVTDAVRTVATAAVTTPGAPDRRESTDHS